MIKNFKQYISRNFINIPGWRTSRKIIVIESDDWGTLRMRPGSFYQTLLNAGIAVDKDPYSKYDSLETRKDLECLFEILKKHKDQKGNSPIITANTIVGNPDFEKIKNSEFKTYFFESFVETQKKQGIKEDAFPVWKQGVDNRLFMPQFHGREHVNVALWMNALANGSNDYLKAFDFGVFGINGKSVEGKRANYMAALDWNSEKQKKEIIESLKDGLELFEKIFGFKSKTMIAPCYIWSDEIEESALSFGVEGFQGISYQYISQMQNAYAKKFHYTGQKNKLGQHYLVRNAFFEPTLEPKSNTVDECLKRIRIAFRWGKPAIIGSHRINYMGTLDESNRIKNLGQLDMLFTKMLYLWPEIEFISSDELIRVIKSGGEGK